MTTTPPPAPATATKTREPQGTSPDPAHNPPTTSVSPDAASIWRSVRGPLLLAALIILVVSVTVLITGGRNSGELDPRGVDSAGSRALAELLRRQGVDVTLATTDEAARLAVEADPEHTTLLVPFPDGLNDRQSAAVAVLRPARTVLIAPDGESLAVFGLDVDDAGSVDSTDLQPLCDLPEAARAGDADLGGTGYRTNAPGATRCYPSDGAPSLVIVPRAPGTAEDAVLLGTGDPLRNDRLDERGNASLSMQLLGAHPTLVWYIPDGSDSGDEGLLDLLPKGWRFGILQCGIALVLFALYRARRLGPVVSEALPVVVRATETAEGRARLYHRGHAVDRAADLLRAAARTRITARLGLGPGTGPVGGTPAEPEPAHLVDAVGARTGRSPAEVHHLLYGAVPEDEDGLVALADQLDRLEERVKTGELQP
ncbi:DUF4350 domain-containing protein [Yinghuangia sp. ASG 101]|uniref:DUF4350 domain-containing protein n=1 Tax=Yinghuangia sp. ASG 101 TaxID=2896848 RepID=UPI001E42B574|nr:DUF4350 domain-containing protein [Yinghuangia sp. ASG 101]UGQ09555.1 DUF4350 domain-containing protein [Yinghuangia sp. ASG 101]